MKTMRVLSVIFLALALYAWLSTPSSAQTKQVFAHYMVCFKDYNNGVAGYEQDIKDAQSYGIDGFALNCGGWDANYQTSVSQMFQAAQQLGTGFKLFFSADMSGLNASNVVAMMKTYSSNSSYFRYNKQPVLSTFSGEKVAGVYGSANAAWWLNNVLTPLKKGGVPVFFVPFFYSDDYGSDVADLQSNYNGIARDLNGNSYPGWWGQVVNGMFYYGGGVPNFNDPYRSILSCSENWSTVMHKNGKIYMAPVQSNYWGRQQTSNGRISNEFEGPIGIQAEWNDIIQNQHPDWVELVTWNDFNESYNSPIYDAYTYWPYFDVWGGYFHPHGGLCAINAYYIDWYKHYAATQTPPPPGNVDNIYWSYRLSPQRADETGDPLGPVTHFNGPIADDIYIVANLVLPATLQVTSGGVATNYPLQNGISDIRVPFNVGAQQFKLIRNSTTLISTTGENVVAQFLTNGQKRYDFFHTSGNAHD